MTHLNQFCYEILQKTALMTSIKDEGCVIDVFFDILMGKFETLQSISLIKHERLYKETSIKVNAYINREGDAGLNSATESTDQSGQKGVAKDFYNFIEKAILKNAELNEYSDSYAGYDFLIKRVNQDKQITFFMVFQFSGMAEVESKDESGSGLPLDNIAASIQLIRCISDIYSNQQQLISLNDRDALTGLYNRKFFDRKMNQLSQMHYARRQVENKDSTFLAILDIDHFKRVNDNFGHLYGDEVLLHFSQQMQKVFRDDDCLFRYGGEEFVVILKNVDVVYIEVILHRFRTHIESYSFPKIEHITVSIGVTQLNKNAIQSDIIDRADHALYYIKEHGRNNVGFYEKLILDGLVPEIITHDDIELF